MKIWDIYQMGIAMGKAADPRGPEAVDAFVQREQDIYHGLSPREKRVFDTERLTNPYPDTRLLSGKPGQKVTHAFVGIDIGVSELLMIDRLNQKGADIDLVIAHHPEGIALTTLHMAMDLQTDIFSKCGVPVSKAEAILETSADDTAFSIVTSNYNRVVDAAKLMGIPYLNMHTPTDNLVQEYLETRIRAFNPRTVGDILNFLEEEPEYIEASKYEAGPRIISGNAERRAGRILVDMTGGTDAGPRLYERLEAAGINTIVAMHMGQSVRDVLRKADINVVLAGHMSSDSLGLNLFVDPLEAQGIKITPGSGFTRFSRN